MTSKTHHINIYTNLSLTSHTHTHTHPHICTHACTHIYIAWIYLSRLESIENISRRQNYFWAVTWRQTKLFFCVCACARTRVCVRLKKERKKKWEQIFELHLCLWQSWNFTFAHFVEESDNQHHSQKQTQHPHHHHILQTDITHLTISSMSCDAEVKHNTIPITSGDTNRYITIPSHNKDITSITITSCDATK